MRSSILIPNYHGQQLPRKPPAKRKRHSPKLWLGVLISCCFFLDPHNTFVCDFQGISKQNHLQGNILSDSKSPPPPASNNAPCGEVYLPVSSCLFSISRPKSTKKVRTWIMRPFSSHLLTIIRTTSLSFLLSLYSSTCLTANQQRIYLTYNNAKRRPSPLHVRFTSTAQSLVVGRYS